MSIIALLHNLLKERLPSIHATRLTALMAAVEAGLKGASVSITELGRMLSGPACIKHKIKRMDRLAGNRHLNTERMAVYGAMTQWLLQSLPMPLILIDWSPLTADQRQQLLRVALPTGGRSVTLYDLIKKMLQQQRHTGMDCRYPDYMDVMFTSLPWRLDSGNPCRTTSLLH